MFSLLTLVVAVRLVVQRDAAPTIPALMFALSFPLFLPLHSGGILAGLAAAPFAFVGGRSYLRVLHQATGLRFWIVLIVGGFLVLTIPTVIADAVGGDFP
jgi:hypothetical protein